MNKILLYTASACISITCLAAALRSEEKKSSGAHPGATGAPGEHTCADAVVGCHVDAKISKGDGVNSLTFSGENNVFEPGKNYQLTVRVEDPASQKFGFEIVALDKNGNSVGEFAVTDVNKRTQILSDKIGPLKILRYYVTHTNAGTGQVGFGTGEWTFGWTAPLGNMDSVFFYYATNATNNNGQNTGDRIYLSSAVVSSAIKAGTEENSLEKNFSFSYDEGTNSLRLDYPEENFSQMPVRISDYTGKILLSKNSPEKNIFLGKISPGAYFLTVGEGKNSFTKKFLVAQ